MHRVDIAGIAVTPPVERTRKRLRNMLAWRHAHSVLIVERASKTSLAAYYAAPLEPAFVATIIGLLHVNIVAVSSNVLPFHRLPANCALWQHRSPPTETPVEGAYNTYAVEKLLRGL